MPTGLDPLDRAPAPVEHGDKVDASLKSEIESRRSRKLKTVRRGWRRRRDDPRRRTALADGRR